MELHSGPCGLVVRVFGQPGFPLCLLNWVCLPFTQDRIPFGSLSQDLRINTSAALILHVALKVRAQALQHGLCNIFSDHTVTDAHLLGNFGIGEIFKVRQEKCLTDFCRELIQ